MANDLGEIERQVQDGIAYARSAHGNGKKNSCIDLNSFIDSSAYDYPVTGKPVSVLGAILGTASPKPHALRRILSKFIDNALEFAGVAESRVKRRQAGDTVVTVLDREPSIRHDMLDAAMRLSFRLVSRNRESGGTELGLASRGS